tara:strand:+ start:210 stop:1124 length:915 start_codon:yes stop_codon:yes gene_type:complete
MNKVFVTGASGFVGSRLVQLLEKNRNTIKMLSRKNNGNYETVVCDLQNDLIPQDALTGVDSVFHLAGFTHDVRDNPESKYLYYKINVDATVQLAKLAVEGGVKRFIFVSSVKAGGFAVAGKCMTELDQNSTKDIYGRTKREAEIKLLEIGQKSDMHVSIVRSSLVYGPGVKGNLRMMLSGIEKGWFPPLPETGNRRSMIHVDDLVRALIIVAKDDRANGEIFIATDGESYSAREIYNAMRLLMGKSVPLWSMPKLLFDIAALISPAIRYKIRKLFGDEHYSSEKLKSLGFKVKRSLREMNETAF